MKKKLFPERAENVAVTQKMLYGVRDELKSDINAMQSRFDGIDSKFESMESRFDGIDSRFVSMESRIDGKIQTTFHQLTEQIHQLHSQVHRIGILVEEQNAKNNIVLDGLTSLFERQERLENR